MSFTINGGGFLKGEHTAGAILRGSSGGWVGLQTWCGTLLASSGLFPFTARILKVGTS